MLSGHTFQCETGQRERGGERCNGLLRLLLVLLTGRELSPPVLLAVLALVLRGGVLAEAELARLRRQLLLHAIVALHLPGLPDSAKEKRPHFPSLR